MSSRKSEASSFGRRNLGQHRLHCAAVRRALRSGRTSSGDMREAAKQSAWRRAARCRRRPPAKALRRTRPHHHPRRRPRTARNKHRSFDRREGALLMRGIFFIASPSRCAIASSHTAPASSSARPTAAEPMSLTVPICASIARVTRSASFSIAVLSSSTTMTKTTTPTSARRVQARLPDQEGKRNRDQRERRSPAGTRPRSGSRP